MAQNISLWGANYSNVPAVDLPKTGGGEARFADPSVTTAVEADVTSGKIFLKADGSLGTGTASGGGAVWQDANGYVHLSDEPGGGSGLEYEEGTWTPSADVAKPTISFTNTHTERPIYVIMSDTSEELRADTDMLEWAIMNWYDAFGVGMAVSSTQINYARTQAVYKTASNFSVTANNVSMLEGDSNTVYMGYFLTNTSFSPYSGSSTRYWRSGRTYKWIAVWAPTA